PGESNIRVTYTVPFTSPGTFVGKIFYPGDGPTSFVVPPGVTLKGEGLESKGVEPRTKASIFQTSLASYKLEIEEPGALQRPQAGDAEADGEERGPSIQFVLPRL